MNAPITPARLSRMRNRPAGQGQHQVWQTMRVRRKQGVGWTIVDLATLCEDVMVRPAIAHYVRTLVKVGYVEQHQVRRKFYRLARDTGPLAPRVMKTSGTHARIFDPNTERVVESAAAEGAQP